MPYGALIGEAFRIVRRQRFLWFFGFFAGMPGFNFSFQWSSGGDSGDGGSLHIDPAVIVAVGVGFLVLVLAALALSTVAQGALAESVAAIHRGEQRGFRSAWRAGRSTFWRVLGVAALCVLCLWGGLLAVGVPLALVLVLAFVLTHLLVLRVLAVVGSVLVGVPAALALFAAFVAVLQFGVRSAVLAGTPVVESLRAGWRLARRNPLPAFLFLLIQQGIAFGVLFVLVIAFLVTALPSLVLFLAAGAAAGITAAVVTGVVAIPAFFAGVGAVGAFGHALWTLGYLKLQPGSQAQV
jgi:hypothetical protein